MNNKAAMQFLSFLLILSTSYVSARSIQICGGVNSNTFFAYSNSEAYGRYSSVNGYTLGFEYETIVNRNNRVKLGFYFEKYGGSIIQSEGGLAYYDVVDFSGAKNTIRFDFYPLCFKVRDILSIDAGVAFNILLSERAFGKKSSSVWLLNSYQSQIYSGKVSGLSKTVVTGISLKLSYDINLSEKTLLIPQFYTHLGVTGEYKISLRSTESMRWYLGVGIKRII
jgi:hypothetical protein